MTRIPWERGTYGRLHLAMMSIVYLVFGASMIWQGERWLRTPAYHNLFKILPEQAWGTMYLIAGIALAIAFVRLRSDWIVVPAVTLGLMLSVSWMLAFIVRYATSGSTTPETFMSFAVFTVLLVRVLMLRGSSSLAARGPED